MTSTRLLNGVFRRFHPTDDMMRGSFKSRDLVMYSFAAPEYLEGWKTTTDQESGGKSDASVAWHPWERTEDGQLDTHPWEPYYGEYSKHLGAPPGWLQFDGDRTEDDGPPIGNAGFLRFSGNISQYKAAKVQKSGFAGARPRENTAPCAFIDYTTVTMKVRGDGRMYTVNVAPHSFIPDDLYQGHLQPPPGEWGLASLSLDQLVLTGKGRIKADARRMDNPNLYSMGLALMDQKEGPFKLDIAWIALSQYEIPFDEATGEVALPKPAPPRPEAGVLEW